MLFWECETETGNAGMQPARDNIPQYADRWDTLNRYPYLFLFEFDISTLQILEVAYYLLLSCFFQVDISS
jgi:hypothetical protein